MKRLLLWTFERGSFQWDVMCCLILAFLFLTRNAFHDVPEYMRVSATEPVSRTVDNRSGIVIFTAKLEKPLFLDTDESRAAAVEMLQLSLGKPVRASQFQPIRDWTRRLVAYAIWKEK